MTEKTTGWPPKRREEYAARIKKSKIWRFSTGPRSAEGKARCARNAAKLSPEWQIMRLALLAQRQFLHQLKQIAKIYSIRAIPPYDMFTRCQTSPYWYIACEIMDGNLRPFGDFAGNHTFSNGQDQRY